MVKHLVPRGCFHGVPPGGVRVECVVDTRGCTRHVREEHPAELVTLSSGSVLHLRSFESSVKTQCYRAMSKGPSQFDLFASFI